MMTRSKSIWAGSITSALVVLYVIYAVIFYPSAFFQKNAVVGVNQCALMLSESNITAIESFLSEANTTIKQGKVSDILLSASLPVKTDPKHGNGENLKTCVEMLTMHLKELKLEQFH